MAKISFDAPGEDFTVREAVAVVSGWDEKGNYCLHVVVRDDLPLWLAQGLLDAAGRRTKAKLDRLWS